MSSRNCSREYDPRGNSKVPSAECQNKPSVHVQCFVAMLRSKTKDPLGEMSLQRALTILMLHIRFAQAFTASEVCWKQADLISLGHSIPSERIGDLGKVLVSTVKEEKRQEPLPFPSLFSLTISHEQMAG